MVHTSFSSLMILLGFLFVMQDIRGYSSAYAHDEETNKNGFVTSDHQEQVVPARKEAVNGVSTIGLRKPWLGGRKIAAHRPFQKEYLEKEIISEHSSIDEAAKKSIGRFHHQVEDDQINMKKMQSQGSKASSELNPSSSVNGEAHDHKKVEAERLLMETKEIVSLMHKDYKGMDKPRRKPPINNHEPRH